MNELTQEKLDSYYKTPVFGEFVILSEEEANSLAEGMNGDYQLSTSRRINWGGIYQLR